MHHSGSHHHGAHGTLFIGTPVFVPMHHDGIDPAYRAQLKNEIQELRERAKMYLKKAGICPECRGYKSCPSCGGTGLCRGCEGTGFRLFFLTCSACDGNKWCAVCRGWRGCPYCRGTGSFPPPAQAQRHQQE